MVLPPDLNAESNVWHPVCEVASVGSRPIAVRLLGIGLVVWKSGPQEAIEVWKDQCPHRGAQLSLGEVVDHQLRCPYHGWQFDSSGHCRHIPAVPHLIPGEKHAVTRFQVRQAFGLVWVQLSAVAPEVSASSQISSSLMPLFPAENDPGLKKINCGPYWVNTSAPRVVENFLDMAHFSWVHKDWLGDAEHAQVQAYEVSESAEAIVASGCQAWQPQSNMHSSGGAWVQYTYQVNHPYAAVLTKVPDAASVQLAQYREAIGLFICPVDPERSLVWFRLAVADFESPESDFQAFQDTIFRQDQPVLESQSPKCLPLQPNAEAHVASDRMSVAYRRLLKRLDIRFGVLL